MKDKPTWTNRKKGGKMNEKIYIVVWYKKVCCSKLYTDYETCLPGKIKRHGITVCPFVEVYIFMLMIAYQRRSFSKSNSIIVVKQFFATI